MSVVVLGKDAKQPNERLDFDIDFSEKWMPEGDALVDADAIVRLRSGNDTPPLVVDTVQFTEEIVKVWLTGGAHGSKWRVQVRGFTRHGRIKEGEFDLSIKEI